MLHIDKEKKKFILNWEFQIGEFLCIGSERNVANSLSIHEIVHSVKNSYDF